MPTVETHLLKQGEYHPQQMAVYNGLDCCLTLEILGELEKLSSGPPLVYNFSRALQAPVLEMMLRGFRIDEYERRKAIGHIREEIEQVNELLQRYAFAVWDKPLNPRSTQQLQLFFYGAMKIPEQWISQKGVRKLSMNRETLEKLETYFYARPIIACILTIRDLSKQLETLETEIDADGRIRTSFNIGGTECVAGDSLVLTKNGLQRIDKLVREKKGQIWSGLNFHHPARFVQFSNREGRKITLEGGIELKCSLEHPVMTARGFVNSKDLTIYDRIAVQVGNPTLWGHAVLPRISLSNFSNHTNFAIMPSAMSRELCEFIGMWLADGSITTADKEYYRITFSNSSGEVQQRFVSLAKHLFCVTGNFGEGGVTISSGRLCEWLVKLGLPSNGGLGTARVKTIPECFLSTKSSMLRALLRGLTLDSHFTDKGLAYGTQSIEMQAQIQQVLLLLGIVSYKLKCGDSTKLIVPRAYLGRFMALVGFVQTDKLTKAAKMLNDLQQWHEPLAPNKIHYFGISEMVPWTGDVYDVTMPSSSPPQYFANGIQVHNTFRFSSSKSVEGTGGNEQNIAQDPDDPEHSRRISLRKLRIADEGWKICGIDLEQAESREVGLLHGILFNDWKYLDACEKSGDLHTFTARIIWPKLLWTGDMRRDREIANTKFYRDFSYRYMAKRGGHLTSYYGTAFTAARSLKMPVGIMANFQKSFTEEAFPSFPKWWRWVAQEIQTRQYIETPWTVGRHFFGRPNDDTTLREAIAFSPQCSTALRCNLGLWRIWRYMPEVRLNLQGHDAVYFQYRVEDGEERIIKRTLELMKTTSVHNGRSFSVPGEAKVGWNLGTMWSGNPDGLTKWRGEDKRERTTLWRQAI